MKKRGGLSIVLGGALFFGILAGCSQNNSAPANTSPEPEVAQNPMVVYGDTIASEGCVIQNRFQHGDKIVFRASAVDSGSNAQLEEATVTVVLGNGKELPMTLGPHGQKETMLWTASYTVPDDEATGTLDYKYIAEFDGQKAEYTQFDVQPTLLTIVAPEVEGDAGSEEEAES